MQHFALRNTNQLYWGFSGRRTTVLLEKCFDFLEWRESVVHGEGIRDADISPQHVTLVECGGGGGVEGEDKVSIG